MWDKVQKIPNLFKMVENSSKAIEWLVFQLLTLYSIHMHFIACGTSVDPDVPADLDLHWSHTRKNVYIYQGKG
jgi:hypothetical protein